METCKAMLPVCLPFKLPRQCKYLCLRAVSNPEEKYKNSVYVRTNEKKPICSFAKRPYYFLILQF